MKTAPSVKRAVIKNLDIPPGRRIIAVSDIHGNLEYFKGLLNKLALRDDDILIIVGDFLEKGPQSLETLRFLMSLYDKYEVHTLCGNCDSWPSILAEGVNPYVREYSEGYLKSRPQAVIRQMCREAGFEILPEKSIDFDALRKMLSANFSREFDFLSSLPTVLETERYCFVHGGLPAGEPEKWTAFSCMKNDEFMHQGRSFPKWVVVGHWPVVLYHENIVDANPIIDGRSHIISIDGGCILKDDGQLNALIIPENGSDDFQLSYYDGFPVKTATTRQESTGKSYYIRYGDNEVEILSRGAEFCRCRHLRTGYEMDILTKYVWEKDGRVMVNDCTDYVLDVKPGDEISIVEKTSRGYFAKKNGVSGWYYGAV